MNDLSHWTRDNAEYQPSGRKTGGFRTRTVLIPLTFILIHFITVNLVSVAFLAVHLMVKTFGGAMDILDVLGDPQALNSLIQANYPVITILYAVILIPVYGIYLVIARKNDPRMLLSEPIRIMDLLPGLAMTVGALGLTSLYFALLDHLSQSSVFIANQLEAYEALSGSFSPQGGVGFLIIGISVMAPITEELLFRGIVQGELRKAMPETAAIIIQAILFAAYHIQPVQASYALIPGILLGVAYAWSRSIWVPIAMHMLFNALGSLLPILVGEDPYLGQVAATAQIAFIAAGILAGVFFHMNRRKRPESI